MKKVLVAGAEIVKPVFAGCGLREAMLGALAIAGETHIALLAVRRKNCLAIAEACLLRRTHHAAEILLHDVAKKIVGVDEVVA